MLHFAFSSWRQRSWCSGARRTTEWARSCRSQRSPRLSSRPPLASGGAAAAYKASQQQQTTTRRRGVEEQEGVNETNRRGAEVGDGDAAAAAAAATAAVGASERRAGGGGSERGSARGSRQTSTMTRMRHGRRGLWLMRARRSAELGIRAHFMVHVWYDMCGMYTALRPMGP